MTSLQDIWDTPAENVSTPKSPPRQTADDDEDITLVDNPKRSRRPRNTLFLESGSEDEAPTNSSTHYASKPGSFKPDIDAFWNDLDDDPESTFQELAPSLDVDALKRQADAKLALHQILPSSSPPRDLGDGDTKEKKGKSGQTKKKRATLNEGRLLGPDGFPALVKQAKNFKPKGKGHELSDLKRLMNMYHFWSHNMYPNTQFIDTVQRTERLCHSKRMHVALGVWRDEAKGLINGHKLPTGDGSDNSGSDNDGAIRQIDVPVASEDERSSPAPSSGPSVPPSSASEGALDDDFDIDAMIREDEANRAPIPSAASSSAPRPVATSTSGAAMDDDEAMWDSMMSDFPDEPLVRQSERWPNIVAQKPAVQIADDDEDMWDMVREMEMEAEAAAALAAASAEPPEGTTQKPATSVRTTGVVGVDPTRRATNDEGWDEMYA